jgi:hypothetical protein
MTVGPSRRRHRASVADALIGAVGVLNLAPGLLVFAPQRFVQSYGVAVGDPASLLLLRHRAVLLALVGAGLTASVVAPQLRTAAVVGAVVSKTSFLLLIGRSAPTRRLSRVARADAAALVALGLALALDRQAARRRRLR